MKRLPKKLESALFDYAAGGGVAPEVSVEDRTKLHEAGLIGGPGEYEGITSKGDLYLYKVWGLTPDVIQRILS